MQNSRDMFTFICCSNFLVRLFFVLNFIIISAVYPQNSKTKDRIAIQTVDSLLRVIQTQDSIVTTHEILNLRLKIEALTLKQQLLSMRIDSLTKNGTQQQKKRISFKAPTIAELVVTIVAVLGFGLSLFNLYIERKDKRTNLAVSVSLGVIEDDLASPLILIEGANKGRESVTLQSGGVRLPKDMKVYMFNPAYGVTFPCELQRGKNVTIRKNRKEFAQDLLSRGYTGRLKIRGFYTDALGKVHTSKTVKFDVEGWANFDAKIG